MSLTIYTDGACEPNPGTGGWGFVVYLDGTPVHHDCGGDLDATNNTMEMTAVIRALEWLETSPLRQFATVYSDSQYVVKGCNVWRHNWKARGWSRKGRRGEGEVKNLDLWKRLDDLLCTAPVKIEWVKGHAGIAGNERADELSLIGRQAAVDEAPLDPIAEQLRYEVA